MDSDGFIHGGMVRVDLLQRLCARPEPFAPGASHFWDDPHISASMLAAHLDPSTDAASRRPEVIAASVRWLLQDLGLRAGDRLLDLGCGPGLYSEQFARAGLHVVGIDASRRSIDYATAHAAAVGLPIDYRYADYVTMNFSGAFDVAVLIYGDLCTLAPTQRDQLLAAVHAALKAGGQFALDVTTPRRHATTATLNRWEVYERGFWRPDPHLVLTRGFAYPERDVYLEQYAVVEANGTLTVYRNWFQDYTVATITATLAQHGFAVDGLWGDLTGQALDPASEWIGVVATKR